MKKILIESDDTHGTTHTTIDLTDYTEMVIKMTVDGMMSHFREFRKAPLKEKKK